MVDPEAAKRFGEWVKRERGRRGWRTQLAFADAIRFSRRTVSALEAGSQTRFAPEFMGAVESAFGWEFGDFERVQRGEEPNRHYPPELVIIMDAWDELPEQIRNAIVSMVEAARWHRRASRED